MARTEASVAGAAQAAQSLAVRFGDRLVRSGDDGYDAARAVWNGMIDRRPAMIARCTSVDDVVAAVAFARRQALPVAVRGGGHGVAGRAVCDDGLVIDLGPMRWVRVDPEAKVAHVGPGAVGADLDRESQSFSLATTGGTDSTTGVIGLSIGGGFGFLARRFGLAADNVLAAEVVLADGRIVRTGDDEHGDLLWALRGGGGNFGVVTELELQLHPLGPEVAVAQVFHPCRSATSALRQFRDFMAGAPDEVGAFALGVNVPPVAPFPEEHHGRTAIAVVAAYAGRPEEGVAALAPLAEFGEPILSAVAPMPYCALQQSFDAGSPPGQRYFWKSQYLTGLPDDAIDAFVGQIDPLPGPFSAAWFEPLGGAIGRRDPDSTAFPHRLAAYNFAAQAGWTDEADDERAISWARAFNASMRGFSTGGLYANYAGLDDTDRQRAFYGQNYQRLAQVKARYDPDGVFSRW